MPRPDNNDANMLRTLQRYRKLALEEARGAQARCAESLAADDAAHARLDASLQSAFAAQRALAVVGEALSGEALHMGFHFGRTQMAELAQAHAVCKRSRERVAQAQERLALRLEEFKVIERLRERRERVWAHWNRHRAQLRLDELGVIKAWKKEGLWPSPE